MKLNNKQISKALMYYMQNKKEVVSLKQNSKECTEIPEEKVNNPESWEGSHWKYLFEETEMEY